MNKIALILVGLILSCATLPALTPQERNFVKSARDKVRQAKSDYSKSQQSTIEAWDYATKADQHAWETESRIKPLEAQIDASHKNEQNLANQVQKYKPFWDTGHKYWGIGAILLGFGILAKRVIILIGSLILLAVIVWGLSFAFPAIRPIIAIASGFFSNLWAKIAPRKRQ